MVGTTAVGVLSGGADGALAAGSMRRALSGDVQGRGATHSARHGRTATGMGGRHRAGRRIAAHSAQVHLGFRQQGPGRHPRLSEGESRSGESSAWRRIALGSGSICGRRLDSAGSATRGLRGVRQRLEPSGLPDPQGDAGRHSAPRSEVGRRAAP